MKTSKKKYTYELDELTVYKLEKIVEVMQKNNHTAENGKKYSKNIAIAEAIDCYYNSVINHDPDFFVRISTSIAASMMDSYFKRFAKTANQLLFNDVGQSIYIEALAEKLNLDADELEEKIDKAIYDSIEGDL